MRVLLDTNILISYLLTPGNNSAITQMIESAILGKFQLLVPEELLEELVETVRLKPHLAQQVSPQQMRLFIALILEIAEIIPKITEPIPSLARDPKDDYLIAYALIGEADYLISGDKDLLELEKVKTVKIVSPGDVVWGV